MTWFRVDDRFHSHPKVLMTSLAARGLWLCAGSWSCDYLTAGAVPDRALAMLGGSPELADELVTAGLWKRTKGGYRFHDWDRYQLDAIAERERKSSAGQAGNHRRWHENRGRFDPDCSYCLEKQVSQVRSDSDRSQDSDRNPPNPSPNPSVVDVVNRSNGRSKRGDAVIDEIIKTIYGTTSRVIDRDWAARIADHILTGQKAGNPVAYVRAVIENEPDPINRFLPH